MADKKITALTASTALSTDDLFHVVDSPASSMFQDVDWRQVLGGGVFLLFILSDIIFSG